MTVNPILWHWRCWCVKWCCLRAVTQRFVYIRYDVFQMYGVHVTV